MYYLFPKHSCSQKYIYRREPEKEKINAVILMEPKWLINIMNKVMEVKMSHPVLENTEIKTLRTPGVMTAKCLSELWKEDHCGNKDQFDLMCLLLHAHGLLQTIKSDPMAGSVSDPVQPLPRKIWLPILFRFQRVRCFIVSSAW